MKRRFVWLLAPAVLGIGLYFSQPAMAQQDLGQQGEFDGEHVDTGPAAPDAGPEAPEATEGIEASEGVATSPATLATTATKPAVMAGAASSVLGSSSAQDPNVEGNFDLQEITGTDVPGAN
jgi:hypothetical protein